MTLCDARKILGLGPDEDPRPHLADFRATRERIAEMVRNAPNETLGDRYQQNLVEFDQALAALREYLEALGLIPKSTIITADTPPSTNAEITPPPAKSPPPHPTPPRSPRRTLEHLATLFLLLLIPAGGCLLYFKTEESKTHQRQKHIASLEQRAAEFVENRRWQEAHTAFKQIELLAPGSKIALLGYRNIELGMAEEQTQFVAYWTGQAIAELDADRLTEAQSAANRVLAKFPAETEIHTILNRIQQARDGQAHAAAITAARQQLNARQWHAAADAARLILTHSPTDPDARLILADATSAIAKHDADQSKAADLLQRAIARDNGQFDQIALDWLREAASLAPDDPEIAKRMETMASYTRTFRVPGDFPSPTEALAAARDRDRIVLAEQTWKGPLVINSAVELQGAGSTKTIIECPATDGSAITIGPNANGARITGISFRHESFHAEGHDRFSAALVRGGNVTFADCHFSNASGHGLAIIENATANANRCQFIENAWNGAAAIGLGCRLEIQNSEANHNFEHGIESWDGASLTLINNRCEGNSRNGIHADNGQSPAVIVGNRLIANREFGLVLNSAANGKISENTAISNLLGGFVIRTNAAGIPVTHNHATQNLGPGLILEKGLLPSQYTQNSLSGNARQEILQETELSHQDPPNPPPAETTTRK